MNCYTYVTIFILIKIKNKQLAYNIMDKKNKLWNEHSLTTLLTYVTSVGYFPYTCSN